MSRQMEWMRRVERWLPEVYLAVGLAVGLVMCFVTAPFFAPDESAQSMRAVALGHGDLIATAGPEGEAGTWLDSGLVHAADLMDTLRGQWERRGADFHDRPWGAVRLEDLKRPEGVGWSGKRMFEGYGNTAVYPPLLYAPAIVGWRIGEARGMTILATMRLARVLCLLMAVLLGWLALRVAVGVRWMLMGYLLLPSVVFLNASTSQDAVLLSVAGMVVAVLSRPLVERREFTRGELIGAAVALGLCGMARPPYLALALVLFVPVAEVRAAWRRWVAPGIAFCCVVLASGGWWKAVAKLGVDSSDEADPVLQKAFLLGHPLRAVEAVLRGTLEQGVDFFRRGTYVIGWNDLVPHHYVGLVLGVCLGFLVMGTSVRLRTAWGWGLIVGAVVLPLVGLSVAEYVIWTPVGLNNVYGLQPRYWLVVMPLGMVLVAAIGSGVRARAAGAQVPVPEGEGLGAPGFVGVAVAVMGVVVLMLPFVAARAFYAEGLMRVLGWR